MKQIREENHVIEEKIKMIVLIIDANMDKLTLVKTAFQQNSVSSIKAIIRDLNKSLRQLGSLVVAINDEETSNNFTERKN